MTAPLDDLLAPFFAAPERAAVLTDFDGTLSPIVDDPRKAEPLPGAVEALRRCAERFARAGVISGRPVAYLRERLDDSLFLSGLYGLEVVDGGEYREHPEAARWRAVVEDAVSRAEEEGPDGMFVEHKGLSLTLHFRQRLEGEPAVRAFAAAEAARTGLEVRSAKASVELHPPVEADKGTAVLAAAEGLDAVCFLGDDVGDLPAFDALDELAAKGVHTVRIGVRSSEAPDALLERADAIVAGPEGALATLERLAGD